jgi:hypothetical protein
VGDACDGVDHESALVVDGNLQADFGSGINELVEDALDLVLQ